jgi:hypothetical protein
LAYTYINQKGHWKNLAILVGLKPEEVPEYLTEELLIEENLADKYYDDATSYTQKEYEHPIEKHLQKGLDRSSGQTEQKKTPGKTDDGSGTVSNAQRDADFDKMLNITLSFLVGSGNDSLASKPSAVRDLVGTIGKDEIEMHLVETNIMRTEGKETYCIGTQYSGHYFYKKDGKHIPIHGIYDINGIGSAVPNPVIEIYTKGNNEVFVGRFYGWGSKTRYRGTFETFEPRRKYPFHLMPKQKGERADK